MIHYVAKRLALLIPAWILVSVAIFSLMRVIPGDYPSLRAFGGDDAAGNPEAAEALRQQLGLDRPYLVQYAEWIWRMACCADMGMSFWTGQPVAKEIVERLPVTIELAVFTTLVSLALAIPAGVLSAIRQETFADYLARFATVGGLSVPGFWIGTLLIVLPAVWFGYLPPMGYVNPLEDPGRNLQQFFFPCIALGVAFSAQLMRMTRSQMLEVLRQDYVRTAWAKGLRERMVIYRHALKNALIPVITLVGLEFGFLLGRTVIIESVFVLPGLGSSTLRAVLTRDYPQVQGNILFIATAFIAINLVVDVGYAWFDPRIKYG